MQPLPQPAPYKNPHHNPPSHFSPISDNPPSRFPDNPAAQANFSPISDLSSHLTSTQDEIKEPMNSMMTLTEPTSIMTEFPPESPARDVPPMSHFNWNFGYFDGIAESLDVLTRTGGVNAQLDQLLSSFLSGTETEIPLDSAFKAIPPHDSENGLFRIPTSNEVPLDGIHSGPPPSKSVWKKFTEARWNDLAQTYKDESFKLPRPNVINRYVNAYMSGLNQHIPFLHLPTLDLDSLELARLLALCSVGALYCFERSHARKLHSVAVALVSQVIL
jgi:hypothetical protein